MDRLLEATARAEQDHFWFHGFRRFVAPLLEQAAEGHANAAILDCGCGTGNNLAMLRRFGSAVGIDLTFSGLKYTVSRGEHSVAQASATTLPFGANAFDIVTSFDVIYALPDEAEKAAVSEMFRVMRPGGHLVLNVAALQMLRGNHSVLGGKSAGILAGACGGHSSAGDSRSDASRIRTPASCRSWPALAGCRSCAGIRSRPRKSRCRLPRSTPP